MDPTDPVTAGRFAPGADGTGGAADPPADADPPAALPPAAAPRSADETDEPPAPAASSTLRWRGLLGGVAGNLIEFLDFAIYGLVASPLAKAFFAPNSANALLSTFLVYATSFAVRPLGGLVLGRLGDRWGRQRLLTTTVIGMSCATAAMGVLPTYATLGVTATLLLVVCRLFQAFFAGGEYAGATTYMVENGSPHRRAYWACWSSASSTVGSALGIGLFAVVSSVLSSSALDSWGWRLLFLLGVPLGACGAYLRRRLGESPEFAELERVRRRDRVPSRSTSYVLRTQWKQILSYVSFQASDTLSNYLLLGFFVTYLTVYVHQSPADASVALLVGRIVQVASTLGAGWVNDRVGRRRTVVIGCAVIIPTVFLVFLIARLGTRTSSIVAACLLATSFSLLSSSINVGLAEMFPVDVRVTAGSIGYNVGTALFGGTAPLVGTFLIDTFHNPFAVACYVAAVAAMSLTSVLSSFHPGPRVAGVAAPADG